MKYVSKIIPIAISLSALAIFLKMSKMEGANQLLIFAMMTLAGLLYVQAFLIENKPSGAVFAVLYRICFIGMATMTIGVLFRFLYWHGWGTMLMVSVLPFLACLYLVYRLKMENVKRPDQAQYPNMPILLPFGFLAIAFILSVGINDKDFYYTFSAQSKTKTYEQFQQEIANAKLHPHAGQQNTTNP